MSRSSGARRQHRHRRRKTGIIAPTLVQPGRKGGDPSKRPEDGRNGRSNTLQERLGKPDAHCTQAKWKRLTSSVRSKTLEQSSGTQCISSAFDTGYATKCERRRFLDSDRSEMKLLEFGCECRRHTQSGYHDTRRTLRVPEASHGPQHLCSSIPGLHGPNVGRIQARGRSCILG